MPAPASVPTPTMQTFLAPPKHNHHVQIIVLVIVLAIVMLATWAYFAIWSTSVPQTAVVPSPTATVDHATVVKQQLQTISSSMDNSSSATAADLKKISTQVAKTKASSLSDLEAISNSMSK